MKIHLNQIPAEGLRVEGDEPLDILDLPPGEPVRLVEPVHYELDAGISDGGLFATGELSALFELECVCCLRKFSHSLSLPHFAVQVELQGPETVDLTPYVREDILLALPPYPHCDRDGGQVCPGLAKAGDETAGTPDDRWKTLDQLNLKSRK